ncbi:hypothetical protein [Chenggangzhangella methanolivorans]|uniref:Uncharacterized protein n=1 Tax=Chenggangzhangella methanolivorans TaxID=1437009 RepID=A0A9E6UKF5_9HYPH|nr:hypothetical protein [Chenggangzhangella methanolivorans]QZN99251.1 hypothetical protein K6K41_20990 [Chenggangzhangella methanolivorans]
MSIATAAATLGLLFCVATDYRHDRELWVSDGTKAGTKMVVDLTPGVSGTNFGDGLFPVPGGVVFGAKTALDQETSALYFSDGTEGGTRRIRTGVARILGRYGALVYFASAETGTLWTTDGTAQGTVEIGAPELPYRLDTILVAAFKGKTLFVAPPGDGSWTGTNFATFLHDPATNVTTRLPVTVDGGEEPRLSVVGDRFVYVRNTRKHGQELWVSDGTSEAKRPLKGILKGSAGALDPEWSPTRFWPRSEGARAYFLARSAEYGAELWSTDGTEEGTVMVRDIEPGPADSQIYFTTRHTENNTLTTVGDTLLVEKITGASKNQLFVTDGTPEGTRKLAFKDDKGRLIRPTFGAADMKGPPQAVLFEGAAKGSSKSALYVGDVSTGAARLLKDINRDADCYGGRQDYVREQVSRGDRTFFSAVDKVTLDLLSCLRAEFNSELWSTDGTPAGTRKVREIYPGEGGSVGDSYRHMGSDPAYLTVGGAPVSR